MATEDTATKKNPELWSRAKSEAKAQLGGKWSARAAQLAVQKYKAEGGEYKGKKPSASKNSLVKWTKQDWQTRPGTPEKAERGGVTHRYLPKAKWESLSKREQVATDRKKVEGDKKGQEIVPNTSAARVKSAAEHLEFQHDPTATTPQPEGEMTRSRLHHLVDMAGDLSRFVHPQDHLPPWVADHVTKAHENLAQVHSYIEPKAHEVMAAGSKVAGKLERNPVGSDEHRSATGGLTAAGRAHFARTEGAHLKPGVKEKNPSGEKARRKGSFLTRFFTNPRGPMKDEKGRPTRLALSAQAWGEPVPDNEADAHRLAAKGRSLLGKSKEAALFDELAKLGAISDEQAAAALDRYESLEKGKPTLAQLGRYAALGAVAGPTIAAVGNAMRGGRSAGHSLLGHLAGAKEPGALGAVRALAGSATTGALGSGAIPLVRSQLDRRAEMGTLKKYLTQHEEQPELTAGKLSEPFEPVEKSAGKKEKDSAMTGITPARHWDGNGIYLNASALGDEEEKHAFATSQYDSGMGPPSFPQVSQVPAFRRPSLQSPLQKAAAGAPTRGGFLMASEIPPFRRPSLESPIVKSASKPVTPMGRLHSAMRVGLPDHSAEPGPSVNQISKPDGFGRKLPGGNKTTI